ncbi:MAG: hypothetical protein JWO12_2508, partial [Frankiales bacterium]|nr:hypothetical protein [Frankiales bacterium]
MIVISGALVLVALVLLVIGLVDPSLGFVYASIAVSLASFVFLVIGILQRRKEVQPDAESTHHSGGAVMAGVGAVARAGDKLLHRDHGDDAGSSVSTLPAVYKAPAAEGATGQVLVVAGRPRYHVEGCRYLAGKEAESVDVAVARADSYTACGVCKPDESLTAAPAAPLVEKTEDTRPGVADEEATVELVAPSPETPETPETPVAAKAASVRVPRTVTAPTARVAQPATKPIAKRAPAKASEPARKAPAKAAATPPAKAAAPVKKAVAPAKRAVTPV